MTNKKLIVKKSNDLVQANFSDFELSVYRVFQTIVTKMQRHNAFAGDLLTVAMAQRECRLTALEYAKEFNIDVSHAYEILKISVDKLMKTSFKIIEYNLKKNKIVIKINVCEKAIYHENAGYIDVLFTQSIMPHLAELKSNFTMYYLSDIAGFNSIYTTRLYEMLMQFKTTGLLKISVEKLRFAFGCVDTFKRHSDFKRYTFEHAVKEINSKFAMKLSFTEIKTGRFITEIHFCFLAVSHDRVYDVVKEKMRTQVGRYKKVKPATK